MRFVELVLQGVRNFNKTHRFPLGEGVTAYIGGAGSGKSTWVDVLVYLLFPDSTELTTSIFKSQDSDICRVALTLDSGKSGVFRLVKDMLRGSSALMKYDPSTKEFSPISTSPSEILQYMSSSFHLPQKDVFEFLYVFRKEQFPSLAHQQADDACVDLSEKLGVGAPPAALKDRGKGSGFPGYQGDSVDIGGGSSFPGYQGIDDAEFDSGMDVLPDDILEIQSQIEILERDLNQSRMVDDIQFKLDGLQSEFFELEQKVKGVALAQAKVDDLNNALEKMVHLADLPGDFEGRVRSYRADLERHSKDIKRLDDELERLEKRAEQSIPVPLMNKRYFKLGMIGGMLALGCGFAGFFANESFRWLALLDILFFGVALVASFRYLDDVMGAERNKVRIGIAQDRRQAMERQFDLESSVVRKTMEQVKVESPEKVIEMYNKRNKLNEILRDAEHELMQQKAKAGLADVEQRKVQVQSEIESIEQQLAGMSGLMMSATQMERKLGVLRDKLDWINAKSKSSAPGGGETSGMAVDAGTASQAGPSALGSDAGSAPDADRVFARLIERAQDLFLVDLEKLNSTVSDRAGQFLSAISARQLGKVTFDDKARVQVYDAKRGSFVQVHELSPENMDKVFLSLRLAMVEVFSKTYATPVLLDDPFGNFSQNIFEFLGRVISGVGRQTQVILLASQVELATHADSSYSL